jgi:N-acetyl-alpha-D-muramate 1-phosphate uridylyltransferase
LFAGGRIVSYNKEQQTEDMRHIDYGLGVLRASAFRGFPASEPFELASVYRRLLAADDLAAFEVPGRFYEIGSHAGLAETRLYLSKKEIPAG